MLIRGLVLAAVLAGWAVQATAAELRFITLDVAPWASIDPASGQPVGVFPSVVREIARRSGHAITMSLQPFTRIDRELEAGTQDCTIIVWNDSRSSIVQRGELVSDHPMGVIARKGVTLKAYGDLKGLTISVLRGLSIEPRFDGDLGLAKDFDVDYGQGLAKMEHRRLDAIAGAVPTILYLAKQRGMSDMMGDVLSLGTIPLVLQCSKASPHLSLTPDLNRAIRDMRDDGTLQRILEENYFT
ncbi:transporter substrate-binding domain-containing protein [Azospirillum sp. TSO22-1]|uniref:substrate-binding periplasmic protein n=1 Tax=Azospirillum sp. TSO22-1 TaxID=716789 RepID=UPI000D617FB1|nr:transporter substrate-binding domain-containing protein [Azospirillum sp. TSO22-1]PWC45786.1 hypothetical protein TSO221_15415 [Azospirillum sp. TSO22-1]